MTTTDAESSVSRINHVRRQHHEIGQHPGRDRSLSLIVERSPGTARRVGVDRRFQLQARVSRGRLVGLSEGCEDAGRALQDRDRIERMRGPGAAEQQPRLRCQLRERKLVGSSRPNRLREQFEAGFIGRHHRRLHGSRDAERSEPRRYLRVDEPQVLEPVAPAPRGQAIGTNGAGVGRQRHAHGPVAGGVRDDLPAGRVREPTARFSSSGSTRTSPGLRCRRRARAAPRSARASVIDGERQGANLESGSSG